MKKQSLIIFFISMTLIFSAIKPVTALEEGDVIEFVVKNAYGNFDYSDGSTTVIGNTDEFRVGNTAVAEDSSLFVEITEISSSEVKYSISTESGTELTTAKSTNLGFGLNLIYYSLYPFIMLGLSSGSVISLDLDKGIGLSDLFYIAPPNKDWNSIADQYNDSTTWNDVISSVTSENEGNLTVGHSAEWYDGGETLSFILSANGWYTVAADDTDLLFIYSLRFDYDVDSSTLLGYKMIAAIAGDLDGRETTFSTNIVLTQEGYERIKAPGFEILFVGFGLLLAIVVKSKKAKK